MSKNLTIAGTGIAAALLLAGCGYTPGERAVTGGLIGAGTGAGIAAIADAPVGAGALVGAGAGAIIGAGTAPSERRYRRY